MNDTYSKIVLTIIAAALSLNTLQNFNIVAPAFAASGVQRVAICDESGDSCARIILGKLRVRDN